MGGGPEEERGDRARASEGGKNAVEGSALGLFEPLCCNPVCDSTAVDPPSPFCVQIHSHSVELCGQRMLSETALKLGGSGHRKLSCGGGCSSSPTPPTNPFPLSSLLVDNGKGKIKQELLNKRAMAL